ncbi:MAG: multidrug ABC transporter substrate-binding protein [Candidatus Vogelbacteria bacterium CG22_combo_CG10-13_8_21_14_all_37_9]|uniref:Multidrug ABC transporter substrate-binding protein n=1 Tax=Candidatus Vogelbacteria bacterium CG22_combo_CG10-13_8_21_14_all_37_9 TaxID=1975046 RepID=A0A2H0BKZ5_9BACT|nr:MAG: hypothetical protein BK005_00115 [bacterium CG10_37_50]PIP58219.1 MAG: multidrug ABC transporter substrate-binding protein [Candidatus Vogelbacteria bacterium CG22_combo_CG10-13_8_21_14_all_37_9]
MIWKHTLKTSFISLSTNRSRSILTILGIVIGVTAIMLVMSLGAGAQKLILDQVQGLGTNTIAVIPGREPSSPSDTAQIFSDSLKVKDLEALKNKANVPGLKQIMPIVFGAETVSFGANTYQVSVFGATELIAEIFDLQPKVGEFFDKNDVSSRSSSVVLGSKVVDQLFAEDDPLGKKIKIKGRNFKVIAVLPPSGGGTLFNFDEAILMSYTTAQDYLFGIKYFNRLIIEAGEGTDIEAVANDVKLTLREAHNISDPSKDDFFVSTQQDLVKRLSTITTSLTWFLIAMASIALFVGGVGIMNIMLVSVTERTREIGLRKSLGATDRDILTQFLLEAVLLTGVGGLVGVFIGTVLALLISLALSSGLGVMWDFVFPWTGAVLGVGVSALIGLIFGGYPAYKASKKSPIEALRYE